MRTSSVRIELLARIDDAAVCDEEVHDVGMQNVRMLNAE